MNENLRKLILMAVLTAIALIVFIIEAQIPLPLPVPGAKLGLANAVTLFALFYVSTDGQKPLEIGGRGVFAILICRIFLGAAFTGRFIALALSLSGGILSFAAQIIMKRVVAKKQIWVCGAAGAVFHNVGQIAAAALITGEATVAAYLPMLVILGIISGTITGLAAQTAISRLRKEPCP